jgi:hypothetical protein
MHAMVKLQMGKQQLVMLALLSIVMALLLLPVAFARFLPCAAASLHHFITSLLYT